MGVTMSTLVLTVAGILSLASSSIANAIGFGFIENQGQVDPKVRGYAPLGSMTAYFTDEGITFDLRVAGEGISPIAGRRRDPIEAGVIHGHAVRLVFDPPPHATIVLGDTRSTRMNYFLGSSVRDWRTDVSVYDELVYRDAWPGIDVVFTTDGSSLSYTLVAHTGAGTDGRTLRWEGAESVTETGPDTQVVGTSVGSIVAVTEPGGGRIDRRIYPNDAGHAAGRDDAAALAWSSFLGGTSDEIGWCLALDANENVVLTGLTLSVAFPTTLGAYDTSYNQFGDVFVCKLAADGSTLEWGTFLGGSATNFDYGYAVTLDAADQPIVTGYTWSSNFPTTTGAFDRFHNGNVDVFVTKLTASGNALVWSTFLGGLDHDIAYSVAVDASANVVVSGRTLSPDFPIAGAAYDPSHDFEEDAFVSKLNADGTSLIWSTYIGGGAYESADAVVLDDLGRPTVCGYTASPDFPTTPKGHDPSWNGGLYDAYALKLEADGSDLVWSTFLGGGDTDYGNGLALDSAGDVLVVGETGSVDYPSSDGAYDPSFNGSDDAFVTKLEAETGLIAWSTFLGGTEPFYETAFGVTVDGEDRPIVTGTTPAADFPTTPGAYDTSHNGGQDVFAARLSTDGTALLGSTFLGASGTDYAWFAGVTASGDAVLIGDTSSTDFPTTPGAFDTTYNGSDQDVWVAQLSLGTTTVSVDVPAIERIGLSAIPNPARGTMRWVWAAPAFDLTDLSVFDSLGRLVWRTTVQTGSQGPREIEWDGTDLDGRPVGAGVYLVRARPTSGEPVSARVSLVR
jgi:hypothetical protein